MTQTSRDDMTVVVGGGLAGLTAAAYLARAGRPVTVLERASAPGGRAQTTPAGEFRMNLGPHALYHGGEAARVLDELGVPRAGGVPHASGGGALYRGRLHALPGGPVSLLTTGLFGIGAKIETARLLAGLPRVDPGALHRTSVRDWLDAHVGHAGVRALVEALFRLTTYAHAPAAMSAGLAFEQLQLALAHGVTYLDGGWTTLVEALRARAEAGGARIVAGASVGALERAGDGRVTGVRLRDGRLVAARAVVLALDAQAAAALLPDGALRHVATAARPVRAACLDVALVRLPRPRTVFALGIDQPVYYSVHSAVARLAPAGGALIHVARYLGDDEPDPKTVERELEDVLDRLQPGWRAVVAERRFLPRMTVASALATAAEGGLVGRPGPEVPGAPGLHLAGDWIGPRGWLADASLASARAAAARVASDRLDVAAA